MANAEIRAKIAVSGLKQYKIAEALGMAETAFSRKLRKELSDTDKIRVLSVIDKLSGKSEQA